MNQILANSGEKIIQAGFTNNTENAALHARVRQSTVKLKAS